jgi:hypothetical protein
MTLDKMIRVLQICAQQSKDASKEWCSAEHDILYLPLANDVELPETVMKELKELGAFKSDVDCWACYT